MALALTPLWREACPMVEWLGGGVGLAQLVAHLGAVGVQAKPLRAVPQCEAEHGHRGAPFGFVVAATAAESLRQVMDFTVGRGEHGAHGHGARIGPGASVAMRHPGGFVTVRTVLEAINRRNKKGARMLLLTRRHHMPA